MAHAHSFMIRRVVRNNMLQTSAGPTIVEMVEQPVTSAVAPKAPMAHSTCIGVVICRRAITMHMRKIIDQGSFGDRIFLADQTRECLRLGWSIFSLETLVGEVAVSLGHLVIVHPAQECGMPTCSKHMNKL